MKKQFIAKLLVLVMLLCMVPATAPAVNAAADNTGSVVDDNTGSNTGSEGGTVIKDTDVVKLPSTTGIVIDAATTSADKVAIEEGSAAITAKVVNGTANVKLSMGAVKKLAKAVEDGVITLVIDDEGADKLNVTLPAKSLTALAKATGADLTIESSVATISLSNSMIIANAGIAGNVKITVKTGEDGEVTHTLVVNGKELKDVEGFVVE